MTRPSVNDIVQMPVAIWKTLSLNERASIARLCSELRRRARLVRGATKTHDREELGEELDALHEALVEALTVAKNNGSAGDEPAPPQPPSATGGRHR